VKRGIKESVDGVFSEFWGIFSIGGPSPEITQAKYESKQRAENLEVGKALLLAFAESCQKLSK
jgi:hypothetical protein